MVKMKVGAGIEQLDSFPIDTELTITEVTPMETQKQKYPAIRLVGKDNNGKEYAEMLWLQDNVNKQVKLGAFLYAVYGEKFGKLVDEGKGLEFEYETDEFLGLKIKYVRRAKGDNVFMKLGKEEVIDTTKPKLS